MPRNLVLFDLEWNIGYQPFIFNYHGVQQTFRGEIIEIGAVKIDEDANVLDTFSIHLRPRIFRCLQHHIAKVTGLTQEDLDKGEPIIQGLRRFMKWCGPDAEFAEWGMDDVPVLKQNLFLCNLDESRPTVWYDLQQLFLREYPRKEGEGMKLENVVTRMGIPLERPFHDALSDTLYTADLSLQTGHWDSGYQPLLPFFSQTSSGCRAVPQTRRSRGRPAHLLRQKNKISCRKEQRCFIL